MYSILMVRTLLKLHGLTILHNQLMIMMEDFGYFSWKYLMVALTMNGLVTNVELALKLTVDENIATI